MGVEVNSPIITTQAMNYNFSNEGGYEGTIRLCKNIIGMWPIQQCRKQWLEEKQDLSYAELTGLAANAGYANSWVNLNDQRFLKPGEMPNKVNSFLKETNQTFSDGKGFLIRVLLESLAFGYKIVLEEIEKVTGKKIDELNIVGGGIQNELLCQLTADALNIPVIAGPKEGTVIGNIGVQAISKGSVKNLKDWRKVVADSFDLKIYNPQNSDYFELNRKKYIGLVNS